MLCKKENCKLIILIVFTHIELALWLNPCMPKTMLAACLWDVQIERPSGITKGWETACRTRVCALDKAHTALLLLHLLASGQQLQCGTSFMADLRIKECKVQPRRISSLYWKRPCFHLGNIGFLPSWYRDPLVVDILLDGAQLKVYHRVVIYWFTVFCGASRAPLHRALCHSVRTSSLNILENITITFLQHCLL